MAKVLFIDTTHPILPEMLASHGFQCDYLTNLGREEYLRIIPGYFGVIIRGKIRIDREIIEAAANLRFIGRVGAGMENIDVDLARSKGILCLNAPEGNRDALGEHSLGMLLMLMNHLKRVDKQVRQGIWIREENRGTEISGKTVAIIGYGNMGSAFARRLQGFDARVIAYDKYKFGYSGDYITEAGMDEVFEEADIVSLHVPLTAETTYLVDNKWINGFRKNIWLINTSRGKVVKTADLVKSLQSGKVQGACLDVLEYEGISFENLQSESLPDDFRYLASAENVVLSPHIAGWTHESNYKLAVVLAKKIIGAFKDVTP